MKIQMQRVFLIRIFIIRLTTQLNQIRSIVMRYKQRSMQLEAGAHKHQ